MGTCVIEAANDSACWRRVNGQGRGLALLLYETAKPNMKSLQPRGLRISHRWAACMASHSLAGSSSIPDDSKNSKNKKQNEWKKSSQNNDLGQH